MEHTLNKSLFIILPNLTCFFLGKKSSFHTTPGNYESTVNIHSISILTNNVNKSDKLAHILPLLWLEYLTSPEKEHIIRLRNTVTDFISLASTSIKLTH